MYKNTLKTLVFGILGSVLTIPTSHAASLLLPIFEKDLFQKTIGSIYNLMYPVAITYGILEIIFAGYKIMSSEGEPKALSEAKEHLTSSIIGIIFVILAVVILRIVIKIFLGQDVQT
jgi:hypothetical protein